MLEQFRFKKSGENPKEKTLEDTRRIYENTLENGNSFKIILKKLNNGNLSDEAFKKIKIDAYSTLDLRKKVEGTKAIKNKYPNSVIGLSNLEENSKLLEKLDKSYLEIKKIDTNGGRRIIGMIEGHKIKIEWEQSHYKYTKNISGDDKHYLPSNNCSKIKAYIDGKKIENEDAKKLLDEYYQVADFIRKQKNNKEIVEKLKAERIK